MAFEKKRRFRLSGYGSDTGILFKFVWRQSEFAFFRAPAPLGALFIFYNERKAIHEIQRLGFRSDAVGFMSRPYQLSDSEHGATARGMLSY